MSALVLAAAVGAGTGTAQAAELGLAQDSTGFTAFQSPSFAPLANASPRFRLIVGYNATIGSGYYTRLERVLADAPASTELVVTFAVPDGQEWPTPASYRAGVASLIAKIRDSRPNAYFGVLNEPNQDVENPTPDAVDKLKGYYLALVDLLGGTSRVIGPDFNDRHHRCSDGQTQGCGEVSTSTERQLHGGDLVSGSVVSWVTAYKNAASTTPGGGFGRAAAFHPYGGVSRRSLGSLNEYVDALPAGTPVWLTEIGARKKTSGKVYRVDGRLVDDTFQNEQVAYMLQHFATYNRNGHAVERLYYYTLNDPGNYDTALVDSGGPRPAWNTFCAYACPDTDGDGLRDYVDRCPQQAGPSSTQGCPDRDGDGIPDGEDRCPDRRGWAEKGGCVSDDLILRNRTDGRTATLFRTAGPFEWIHGLQLDQFGASQDWTPLIGDFDGQNGDDLMLRNGTHGVGRVAIAYNNGHGEFTWNGNYEWAIDGVGADPVWVPQVGNFVGDGASDLLLRNRDDGRVVLLMKTTSGFSWVHQYQLDHFGASQDWTPLIGDFDGQNGDDLMLRNGTHGVGRVAIAYNNGNGVLSWNGNYEWAIDGVGADPVWVPQVGNFAGDGASDLLLRNRDDGRVVLLMKSPSGFSWVHQFQLEYFGGSQDWTPLIGDFDGQNGDDLMLRNGTHGVGRVAIAYNSGHGVLSWDGNYEWAIDGVGADPVWQPLVARLKPAVP